MDLAYFSRWSYRYELLDYSFILDCYTSLHTPSFDQKTKAQNSNRVAEELEFSLVQLRTRTPGLEMPFVLVFSQQHSHSERKGARTLKSKSY